MSVISDTMKKLDQLERERDELLAALRHIAAEAPEEEPEYDDWGGDTEAAEMWGMNQGWYEAALIARAAIIARMAGGE